MEYILVTPAKNEEEFLPILAESVLKQSKKPFLWVIVNDGSTDLTSQIINKLSAEHEFIVSIDMPEPNKEYDSSLGYARVTRYGLSKAEEIARARGLKHFHYGIVDADFKLEPDYFEKLLIALGQYEKLGIVSGQVYELRDGQEVRIPHYPGFAFGSPRLMREECFREIGGYHLFFSPDALANYMAKMKGWRVGIYPQAKAVQLRALYGRQETKKNLLWRGRANAHLGTPLRTVLLWSLLMGPKGRYFLQGYLQGRKEKPLVPEEVREFMKREMGLLNAIRKFWLTYHPKKGDWEKELEG